MEKTFFLDTRIIGVPRDFVFNFLIDFSERGKWIEGLVIEDVIPAKGKVVGTKIRETILIHGYTWECKVTITECIKNEYLKMIIEDDKENIILDYTLTSNEDGTSTLSESATITKGTTIHRWITGLEKHTLDKRLNKFKEVVEKEYNKK